MGNTPTIQTKEILEGKEARNLRGAHKVRMVPEACNGCKLKEKSGKSRRLYFWDRLDWDVKLNSKDLEIKSTPDIRYLDFTLSNKCNGMNH